jgi:hypothetical protein
MFLYLLISLSSSLETKVLMSYNEGCVMFLLILIAYGEFIHHINHENQSSDNIKQV